MYRAGQAPESPGCRQQAGDDLLVHPMSPVLAGTGRPVCGHPVDGDSGAVDHRIGVAGVPGGGQGLARLRGAGGQQRHRPGEISLGGDGIDVESGGQLAFAQAGQDEQGRHRG
jgi:hypothetical protein